MRRPWRYFRAGLRFWPHVLVVAFLHVGYHRAQFSNQERQRLYQRFLQDPVGASLADPIAAIRVHHVRDGDEYLYLAWANLMLGRPFDREYLAEESDARIPLLPFHSRAGSEGLVPYRDFVFQYPPLAIIPMVLPALITSDPVLYPYAFGVLAGLAGIVIAIAGWAIGSRLSGGCSRWMSAGALFLVGVTLETRLDVFAAAIVAVALWAALTGRWILAGALLGAGAALKVYPGLLIPAFLAVLVAQRRHRQVFACLAAFMTVLGLSCLPAALASWNGFLHAVALQFARDLQIESVGATAVAWIQRIAGLPIETARQFGARDLVGPFSLSVAAFCRLLAPAMALLGASLPWWLLRQKGVDDPVEARVLLDGMATSIAGLWIGMPVLSPQYLVWGLPVFLFVSSPAARLLYLLALGATRIEYPACYPFVSHLQLSGLVILSVRNGLLVATWAVLLRSWIQRLRRRPSDIASVRIP